MNSERPSKIPMLASLAFPGAGQFIQGRFIAGTLYAILICITCFMLMAVIVVPIFYNLNAAMTMEKPLHEMSFVKIGLWALAFLLIYIVNMIDVYIVYRSALSTWMAEKHGEMNKPS